MNSKEQKPGKVKLVSVTPDDNDRARAQAFLVELLGGLAAKPENIPARLADYFAAARFDESKRQRERAADFCRAGFALSKLTGEDLEGAVACFAIDPAETMQRIANAICGTLARRIVSSEPAPPRKEGEQG